MEIYSEIDIDPNVAESDDVAIHVSSAFRQLLLRIRNKAIVDGRFRRQLMMITWFYHREKVG